MATSGAVSVFVRVLVTVVIAFGLASCGGNDSNSDVNRAGSTISVWILEFQPDRVRAMKANAATFSRRTGIRVQVVPIGDDELPARMARARKTQTFPDVAQLPLDSLHAYAGQDLLDTAMAEELVESLGDDTFSQTALTLASQDGEILGVPSDGWGQLLIYRKDLFEKAGLQPPETLDDVRDAARRLDRDGIQGITLPNAPDENFTSEIFEHLALAEGCELVDDSGAVTLDSPPCRSAFRVYVDLARGSAGGDGDEVTRDVVLERYFAGRTAMILWSPFLLDAMAGLRDDVQPTCPQCQGERAFLARNSGLVGRLSSDGTPPAQYGSISSWGIFRGESGDASRRFVEYMLTDGYTRWLAVSPQGKFPVRPGDAEDPERYVAEWQKLESGVERKAPLRRFYGEEEIASLGEGVQAFRRWGFTHNEAALLGAVRDSQPVSRALAAAIAGRITPEEAAAQAQAEVERLRSSEE